jgi:hypothetical protein
MEGSRVSSVGLTGVGVCGVFFPAPRPPTVVSSSVRTPSCTPSDLG